MQITPRIMLHPLWLLTFAVCLPVWGQNGAVSFKHFRTYPAAGQWTQELQGFRNGVPLGPPQKTTSCASPLAPAQVAAVKQIGNDAAPMCTMKVLKDEERTAEYEQSCNMGLHTQVTHSTMKSIDDRTIFIEVQSALGGREISSAHITTRYMGPCTAEQAAEAAHASAAMPAIPKPSPEQCAEVPEMKRQMEQARASCTGSDVPEAQRAGCLAALKRASGGVQQMEAQCK